MEILHSEIERILLNESINKSLMANLVQGVIRYKNHMYLRDKRETNLYDESNLLIYVFYDGRPLNEQYQDDVFYYLYEEIQEVISEHTEILVHQLGENGYHFIVELNPIETLRFDFNDSSLILTYQSTGQG